MASRPNNRSAAAADTFLTAFQINASAAAELKTAVAGRANVRAVAAEPLQSGSPLDMVTDPSGGVIRPAMNARLEIRHPAATAPSRTQRVTATDVNAADTRGFGLELSDSASVSGPSWNSVSGSLSIVVAGGTSMIGAVTSAGGPAPARFTTAELSPGSTRLHADPHDPFSISIRGTLGARGPPLAPGPALIPPVGNPPTSDVIHLPAPSSARDGVATSQGSLLLALARPAAASAFIARPHTGPAGHPRPRATTSWGRLSDRHAPLAPEGADRLRCVSKPGMDADGNRFGAPRAGNMFPTFGSRADSLTDTRTTACPP
ncbi:MAG: hypothetical protein WAL63_00725 [Solirubrobacteraceae bacterium]